MLQVKTEELKAKVAAILERTSCWFPFNSNNAVHIDDFISYDEMAAIVDAIRGEERKRRTKARQMGIHSNIDKLWVTDDTIWLRGCDETKAKMFIDQLGDIGYDVDELTKEYIEKWRITI